MKKDIIIVGIVSFFVFSAVIYGFTVVGLPQNSRAIRLDSIRRNDLSNIKSRIDSYYSANYKLPKNIKDAVKSSKYVKILDPETNKPYEYYMTDKNSYKLCATFKTKYPKNDISIEVDYSYSTNLYHKSGYNCFNFDVKSNQYSYNYPTSTPSQPPIKFADDKILNVTTTSPYDQSSKFPEGFFTSNPQEYGLVNDKNQNVYVTVSFIKPVKLSQITTSFANCESTSCDPFSGSNLINIDGETDNYQRITLTNNLKIADSESGLNIPVTTDKEFSKISFRVFGPIIWKKIKFTYK